MTNLKPSIALLALLALGGCESTYTRYEEMPTEGSIVRNCQTTADEARRWMDVCRRLEGKVHRLETGERCYFSGRVGATLRYYDDGLGSVSVTSRDCGTDAGDFMCDLDGDGCPIRGVYQQLGASQ